MSVLRKKRLSGEGGGSGTGHHTHAHIDTHPRDPGAHRFLNASAYHLVIRWTEFFMVSPLPHTHTPWESGGLRSPSGLNAPSPPHTVS